MNQDNNNSYGYLFAIAATLFWSGNFVVSRGMTDNIPPVSLAYWRWVTAVVLLMPFAIKSLITDWHIIKNNFGYFSIVSILGVSLFNTLIYIAGHTTTALNMSLIAITFPVFIIIISRIAYQELITINKMLGILLVIAGVLVLITKGNISVLRDISFTAGDLWMLLAAIAFALYSILLKHRPAEVGTRSFQLGTFIIGLVYLAPFYLWEASHSDFSITAIGSSTLYSILYLGLFASLFSYILWSKAVHSIGPVKSSMIYYTLPVFSGIVAYILLGEKIATIHVISMLLIILGVVIAIYNRT